MEDPTQSFEQNLKKMYQLMGTTMRYFEEPGPVMQLIHAEALKIYNQICTEKGYCPTEFSGCPVRIDDEGERGEVRANTLTASLVKYFVTANYAGRMEKYHDSVSYFSGAADKDSLKLQNIQTRDGPITPNISTFVNPLIPGISATPDATIFINGVLCPVEIKRKNSKQIKGDNFYHKNSEEDEAYDDIKKRKRTKRDRSRSKANSLRNLQKTSPEEIKSLSNLTHSSPKKWQKKGLSKMAPYELFPVENASELAEHRDQIQAQMFCLRSTMAYLIIINGGVVNYEVIKRDPNFSSRLMR